MGCDIHLHAEVKINGEWQHYSIGTVDRNYALFDKLAGVRHYDDSITPISLPRGLPTDCTFMTRFDSDHWGVDGHSHSYISSLEWTEIVEWFNFKHEGREGLWRWESDQVYYLFGNSWSSFHKYRDSYPKEIEDFRFVSVPLQVDMQHDTPTLWALVETFNPLQDYRFLICGTGNPMPEYHGTYLNTFFSGPFVWHVFVL